MASSGPASLDTSGSADEKFRELAKRMASEINGFSAGRQKGMQTPPQHTVIKNRIRSLIGDKPTGHYDNAQNRRAFWGEIDQILGAVKPLETEWHKTWLRAINEVITEYRSFAAELLNGSGSGVEERPKNPEAQKWEDFRSFLENSVQASDQSETPELNEFYRNMTALTDSVIGLYGTSKEGAVTEQELENFVCEMLQAFEYLRTSDNIRKEKETYAAGLAVLKHMIEKEPIPEYLKEFLAHEVVEFEHLMAQVPEEAKPILEEAPVSCPDTVKTLVTEPPVVEQPVAEPPAVEPPVVPERVEEELYAVGGYGTIERFEGGTPVADIQKMTKEFSEAIDEELDADRIRLLFRHNLHEFMDAMTQVIDDLIDERYKSAMGWRLLEFLSRNHKGVFATSIVDTIIRKIGWPTIAMANKHRSDEAFYDYLHDDTNNLDETCFESAALLTLSALMGKKSKDLSRILRRDRVAKRKIGKEMSQIDAQSFKEAKEEDDLKGGTDYEFITSEVDWFLDCLENGYDEDALQEKVEAIPTFEIAAVPDMVKGLTVQLDEFEIRACQLAQSKQEILARMGQIDGEISAEQRLEQLKKQESEHKAKVPDFESEEFRAWTEAGIALGEQKRILRDRLAMRGGQGEELEDEKLCLEENLAAAEYDLKEVAEAIGFLKDKLRRIGEIAFDNK